VKSNAVPTMHKNLNE